METEGIFAPETPAAARDRFASLAPAAKTVLREVGRELSMDTGTYQEQIDDDLRLTAQESIFASLLAVRVGTRTEYEQWRETADVGIVEVGSENVDHVVWHAPPFADTAVAATFQNEREAAVGTLRRQAFGRLYRDVVHGAGATAEDRAVQGSETTRGGPDE
ncbi:MAG: DUF5809 family protein [Halovenus sp.]